MRQFSLYYRFDEDWWRQRRVSVQRRTKAKPTIADASSPTLVLNGQQNKNNALFQKLILSSLEDYHIRAEAAMGARASRLVSAFPRAGGHQGFLSSLALNAGRI